MTRYIAERPTLAEADETFIDSACDYFRSYRAENGPTFAAERTANLIADHLTERETGLTRRGLTYGSVEHRGWWRSVFERQDADAVQIVQRMREGDWDGARDLLGHCLDFTAAAKSAA